MKSIFLLGITISAAMVSWILLPYAAHRESLRPKGCFSKI